MATRRIVETFPAERPEDPGCSWDDLASDACRDRYAELLAATRRTEPGQEAVALARDVVSGIYSGAGSGELFVTVELTRLA